jgi:hypothetical protein
MWNDFPDFLPCIFYIFGFFTSYLWQTAIFWDQLDDYPRTMTHARDHWWTLDFANAFLSPGVNSRAELLFLPRAHARNGAPRRWLGD